MKAWVTYVVIAATLGSMCLPAQAQALRDPTQAPAEVVGADGGPTPSNPLGTEGMAVVVREGKPYLVVGTRLYATGQKVGQIKVERITETEVWLRDGQELRKMPRFADIQRSVSKPLPACVPRVVPSAKDKSEKSRKIKERPAKRKAASKAVPCDAIPS